MARPKFDMAVLCRHGAAALVPFQDWSGTRGRPNQRTRLNGVFTLSSPILDRCRPGEAFLGRCPCLATPNRPQVCTAVLTERCIEPRSVQFGFGFGSGPFA